MKKTTFVFVTVALGFLLLHHPPAARSASGFYEGKMMTFIVSFPPGGGYDIYARLLARHLPKYIPGKPGVLVQNMPGAGGVIASNYVAKVAKPDGLTLGVLPRDLYLAQIAGRHELKADFTKMHPVGSLTSDIMTVYMRTDTPYTSISAIQAALKEGKKPPPVGASGIGGGGYIIERVAEEVVGMRLFDIVTGYPGGPQIDLAVRKGELLGAGRSLASVRDRVGDLLEAGKITIIVQTGTAGRKRSPQLPDVPTLWELARTKDGKALTASYFPSTVAGRPFWLPAGVPMDRVKVLRSAFDKAAADPKLRVEAKKSRRPIGPVSGDEMVRLYREGFRVTPGTRALWKNLMGK